MKIEINEDKIILYLYNFFFSSIDEKVLIKEIKKIFIKLIKYYNIDIHGFYDCIAYENKKYGTILEIISTKELLFNPDLIDLKVKFYKNKSFYLRSKDYFIFKNYNNIYYDDKYYYIDIDMVDNLISIIEFIDIIYNEKDSYLKSKNYLK